MAGIDTPRTNIGDTTYLNAPDFDISQDKSFQSPLKDNNLLHHLQNGRRGAIRTPRSRVPFGERKNLPNGYGGGEFTPLLKSATRNSAIKFGGKENGIPKTPAFLKPGGLDNIAEDLSPVPNMGSSMYGGSQSDSYVNGTPMPQMDSSSAASTPMALLPRRKDGDNVLQDSNQLSLREQENVIDKIEKENFGLKLKIHFLEEALRKSGPGYSELALKENTELKVDKVTMQKELLRYKKTLTAAEHDLELYRQQILEMQDKVRKRHADAGQKEELAGLQKALEDREAEVEALRDQLRDSQREEGQITKLRDEIGDLEADLREKDRVIDERDDQVGELESKLDERARVLSEFEDDMKAAKRREIELEEKADAQDELVEAEETIKALEQDVKRLKAEVDEVKEDRRQAMSEKQRAESDLEELQDELANKSITTKGLSRQIEEKANKLQNELEDLKEIHSSLQETHAVKTQEVENLREKNKSLDQLCTKLQSAEQDLLRTTDEKDLLQVRHDALTSESASLQKDLSRARSTIEDLEDKLDHEKTASLQSEREVRDEYKGEISQLNDEIEDLRADIREKERLYDDNSEKWESVRRNLESERERAEEKCVGLQQTIDKLYKAEGTLSGKEMKLQQALDSEKERFAKEEANLIRRIQELTLDIETRRLALEELRSEISGVSEELRLSQREQKSLVEKVEALEDEIEVLQTTLDDESDQANADISAAKQESDALRAEIAALKLDVLRQSRPNARSESNSQDIETQLRIVIQEKQDLQDRVATFNIDTHSLQTTISSLEAERDEIKSQLKHLQQQEDTFRLDQEKIDLRTSKMKLDNEVRRLRDEVTFLTEQHQATEKELQLKLRQANTEEARLKTELSGLRRKSLGAFSEREMSSEKGTIQRLECRVLELEALVSSDGNVETGSELSILRRNLSTARQKETDYLKREAAQKDVLRSLKKQIAEFESRAHDLEISRIQSTSPRSSASGSAQKSEIIEVRHQLAQAHQTLKDLRTQVKSAERDAMAKVSAVTRELENKSLAWDSEKDSLERNLELALLAKNDLAAKNTASEKSAIRLRSKIERLEKELQAERHTVKSGESIALERRDLHSMLRDTQIRAESLEIAVQKRNDAIAVLSASESELRTQLKRVRDERATQRDRAVLAVTKLEELESRFKEVQDDKRRMMRGVRFPNVSISEKGNESELMRVNEEAEIRHRKELRGLTMQIEWLRARCRREEGLRADVAYAKRFMLLQVGLYDACNKADLQMLQQMGISPDRTIVDKKPTLRTVALMVMASVRMKRGAMEWAKNRKVHEKLVERVEVMKRRARRSERF